MKRNLVNFTRGSQLLGHFSFMFAAGLKGPLIVACAVIALVATALALAVLFRDDFVAGVRLYRWGYFPQWGPASAPFFLVFFAYMAAAFTDYVRTYRSVTTPIRRQQIKFVLVAFIIAYLGSVDFFPAFGYDLYPFGYVPIFLLTVGVLAMISGSTVIVAASASTRCAYSRARPKSLASP